MSGHQMRPAAGQDAAVAQTVGRIADYEFFFDFDGTLSAIVADPALAAPVPGVAGALARLTGAARRVTVVSARPVAFLADQLGAVPGLVFSGLYGLEFSADGGATVSTLPAATAYEREIDEVVLAARAAFPDLLVEDKRLSCAVHFRSDPEREGPVIGWAEGQAARRGLRLQLGRMVVELKPPVAVDKGAVVLGTAMDAAGAWYFGDDLGDLPAFAALDRLVADRPGFHAVRVAVANREGPGAVLGERADVLLSGPEQVPGLVERLGRRAS